MSTAPAPAISNPGYISPLLSPSRFVPTFLVLAHVAVNTDAGPIERGCLLLPSHVLGASTDSLFYQFWHFPHLS